MRASNKIRNLLKKPFFILALTLASFITSCQKDSPIEEVYVQTPYNIEVPFGFPTKMNIPADNPMTVEGVELGRYLFYDGRLSGRAEPDSLMSCATCHRQERSFEAGIDHPQFQGGFPHGITGIQTHHVMLPLINLVWNKTGYGWNGSIYPGNPDESYRNIEDFVRMAVTADSEINGDTVKTKQMIQSIPGYPELFKKAFNSETVTFKNIEKAIAQFVRTLISANSKFDQYMRGEDQLSQSELNGYVLFTTEEGGDCFHCHGNAANPLWTDNLFHNNGLDATFSDLGLGAVTGNPADNGKFKTPSLRNLAYSAPYMHDGRFATLDEVINHYSEGLQNSPTVDPLLKYLNQGGVQLSVADKAALKAFLLSLSDDSFINNPNFQAP